MQDDVFMAEAMRRYRSGKLSNEAFLAIVRSKGEIDDQQR